jgi:hypothetical protein
MELQLAGIATNEKMKLDGFKVLGVFPFYLRFINTGTHIRLCAIKDKILTELGEVEPRISDFENTDLQKRVIPLINEFIVTALVNDRMFSWAFRALLNRKIKKCGHYHILNLYTTIVKLDEPAFFLTYWRWMTKKENTLLREVKPS